ncbi:hypothetical protein C0991_012411 [Blastosporella zonata]|nr:hypothetical protein C0991_012411 [Blastosporella zonata]
MSFVAAARQSLSSATRTSLRNTSSTFRAGARRMNSSHAAFTPKSDKPWIIAAAVLFGPAFLYLVSPSARKNTGHFVHNDAHDFPGHKAHKAAPVVEEAAAPEPTPEPAPEPAAEPALAEHEMKDSEGQVADILDSLVASADDVPAADPVGHEHPAAAIEQETKELEPEASKDTGVSSQETGSNGPADLGEAVNEGNEPKKAETESS